MKTNKSQIGRANNNNRLQHHQIDLSIISKSNEPMLKNQTAAWKDTTSSSLEPTPGFIDQQQQIVPDINHHYNGYRHDHHPALACDVYSSETENYTTQYTNYHHIDTGNLTMNRPENQHNHQNAYTNTTVNHMMINDEIPLTYDQQNSKYRYN